MLSVAPKTDKRDAGIGDGVTRNVALSRSAGIGSTPMSRKPKAADSVRHSDEEAQLRDRPTLRT